MKKKKDLTEKAVKKELRGYYYAGVHQYEGECAEDKFIDIVCCDKYGVSYESCYDGWDYIIRKVPDYEDVCAMELQIKRSQEQLEEANAIIEDMRPFIQASMSRQTFTRILNYEDKWGVK